MKGKQMKEVKILLLAVLLIMSALLYGCRVETTTKSYSMSEHEREQFAEMVAEKVIELQRQQHSHDLHSDPD